MDFGSAAGDPARFWAGFPAREAFLQAVHLRHHQVAQDEVRATRRQDVERLALGSVC